MKVEINLVVTETYPYGDQVRLKAESETSVVEAMVPAEAMAEVETGQKVIATIEFGEKPPKKPGPLETAVPKRKDIKRGK